MSLSPIRLTLIVALVAFPAATVWAQLPDPRLKTIFPPGAARGSEVEVAVTGTDLDDATTIVFSHPGLVARPKTEPMRPFDAEPRIVPDRFIVAVASDVPPGAYEARVLGRFGLSTPRSFAVGTSPERVEEGDPKSHESAMAVERGSVVNGRAANEAFDFFRFSAKAGERLTLRCAAGSVDSPMLPRMELLSAEGDLLAVSRGDDSGDAAIDYAIPSDGERLVKVFDATYRGGEEFIYRLTLVSPSGTAAPVVDAGVPAVATHIDASSAFGDAFELSSAGLEDVSVSNGHVVSEEEASHSADTEQTVDVPSEIVGVLPTSRDRDRFAFGGKAQQRFVVDVRSRRIGAPTDLELVVERKEIDANGAVAWKEVAVSDDVDGAFGNPPFDRPSRDPSLLFVAAADGEYRISVRDLAGGVVPDPSRIYALSIREPKPDFRLLTTVKNFSDPIATGETAGSAVLRQGGTTVAAIQIYRDDGFDGEVTISAVDLPAGVTSPPVLVGPNRNLAFIALSASPEASAGRSPLRIVGEATIDGSPVRRPAAGAIIVREKEGRTTNAVARLADGLAFSVIAEPAPIAVEFADASEARISRAGTLSIPVRVVRREGAKGAATIGVDGGPKELVAQPLSLAEGTPDGTLQIKVDPKAPLGAIPFVLTAKSQVAYRRNPEAAAKAADRLATLDATIARLTAENADADTLKQAAEERTKLEKRVQELTAAAEAKEISVVAHSLPFVATIVEAPFDLVATPPANPLNRDGQVDIAIDVSREFGFDGPVEIEAVAPSDFTGVAAEKLTVPSDAANAALVLKAAKEGPVGSLTLTLRASSAYEGARLQIERTLTLDVAPPAAAGSEETR